MKNQKFSKEVISLQIAVFSFVVFIAFFFFSVALNAQPNSFEKRYGLSNSEFAVKMIPCRNGGFFALAMKGQVYGKGYAIRFDIAGNIIWQRMLEDTTINLFSVKKVIQTKDNGFCILAAPRYGSSPSLTNCLLIKIDSLGQLLWHSAFRQNLMNLIGSDLTESPNGNLYVSGIADPYCSSNCPNNYYVLKLNSTGQLVWCKYSSQSSYYNGVTSIMKATTDSTIFIAFPHDTVSEIVKLDSSGNTLQSETYLNYSGLNLQINDWQIDTAGNINALLFTDQSAGVSFCKLDLQGNPVNALRAFTPGFTLKGIQLLSADTGYLALLQTNSSPEILITDWTNGFQIPNAIKVGIATSFLPFSFDRKPDGSLFIYGSSGANSFNNLHLIKTDIVTSGILPMSGCPIDTTRISILPFSIINVASNFTFSPVSISPATSFIVDSVSAILSSTDCFATAIEKVEMMNGSVLVYPNPASSNAIFHFDNLIGNKTLIIYNQLGKEIWRNETEENQIEFFVQGYSAGLYFYRVEQKNEIKGNGKFIIEK